LARNEVFYDEHPFDWVESYRPEELRAVMAPLLVALVESLPQHAQVFDVGCGGGRVMSYLSFRGHACIGLDRSARSVQLMRKHSGRPGVVADNLRLPLAGDSVEYVISDGVIHHTEDPAQAFRENCRILRPGGTLYLAVYKPGGRYEFLYRTPGALFRWGLRSPATRWLVHATAVPLYFAVHRLRSRGKVTWRGARNLFHDYFASPRVAFLSREMVEQWAQGSGMEVVSYDPSPGLNIHAFVMRKRAAV